MGDTSFQFLDLLKRTAWGISFILGILGPGNLYAQCTITWYRDADNDGFGTSNDFTSTPCNASAPTGYVANDLDCNDGILNPPAWLELDRQIGTLTGFVPEVDMAADSTPFVMFVGSSNRITVVRYDKQDENWHIVGSPGFSTVLGSLSNASMALDEDTPYVSYASQSGGNQLVVMKYSGVTWQTIPGLPVITSVEYTNIAIYNGEPYVVYTTGTHDLFVLRYTAGVWQSVGGTALGNGSFPRLAVDKTTGAVYVSYSDESDGSGKITVRKFSGSWTTVGSQGFSGDIIEYSRIAVSNNGILYVAYFDYAVFKIVVQQYTSDWNVVGANDVYADYPLDVSLAVDAAGTPFVAYSYMNVGANANYYAVKKLSGGTWQDIVTDPLGRGETSAIIMGDQLSIAVAPDGIPYVAFRDINNSDYISVMQVGASTCPLPIALLYFKAVADEARTVHLSWGTASEINLDYFTIERTTDGQHFTPISRIPGHGNSGEAQHYDFTDDYALAGKNYYRLKSVDLDGSFQYSKLVVAEINGAVSPYVTLYPNPNAGTRLWYRVTIEPLPDDQLQILNNLGQEVYRMAVDPFSNEITFDTMLKTGTYILKYLSRNGQLTTRFVVL